MIASSQSSLNVTRVMSSERELRSGLSQFHCTNEVKQGHKVQKINCSPDYILERQIFGVDFENFAVSRSELDPNVYIGEAGSKNAPQGQDKSSSFTADKMV